MNSPIAACISAAGSVNAGVLLYRASYWIARAKIYRDGHLWYARSRNEWLGDTGLTRNQYNKALAELKARDLLVTEQHLFRDKNVTFMRFGKVQVLSAGADAQVSAGADTPSYYGEEINGGDSAPCASGEAGASQVCPEEVSKKEFSGESEGQSILPVVQGGKDVKASDFIAQAKMKPKEPPKTEVGVVAAAWREGMEARKKFCAPFTIQQLGQLKHVAKRCPKGQAPDIVRWAVDQWGEFTEAAKEDAGAFSVPSEPQTGFLLKFIAVAIDRHTQASAPKQKWQPTAEMEAKWAKLKGLA